MKRIYFFLRVWLVIIVLTACSSTTTVTNSDGTVSTSNRAPAVIATPDLPGRLLMSKAGDLMMWQAGNLQQITKSGDAWQPAFSRDGTRIVFVRRTESASDIMLTSAAGGEAIQLTDNMSRHALHSFERIYDSTWALYPSFSPDGSRIVYASQFGPPEGSPASEYRLIMYFMDARAGAKRIDGYADGSGNIGHSIFDVDGKNIYFAFNPAGQNGAPRIMRYTIESGRLTIPTGMPDQSYDPALSPDGQTIYFALRTATGTDIFGLPVNGGTPTQLTTLNTARAPAISPDGSWLVYLAVPAGAPGFELYAQKLKDGAPDGDAVQMTRDQLFDADSGISWGN
jgi:TolB protein